MRFKVMALACAIAVVATCAAAQTVAPVVVASTPATTAAVVNSAWWSGLANEAITAFTSVLTIAVATLGTLAIGYIRSKSKLAGMLVGQAMFDKLIAGIQNQIRVEADALRHRIGVEPVTPELKQQIADRAQPKIEAAFKETLSHFDKAPGSQAINDMISGRVDQALAKPVPIPAVIARS